ncbi:binding-protein-dependent transport systems inner membrane component [Ferrimonas balearica DSM 9799]|uniref:Oligopeptide transport system permease protein OppB n=1 Tax=Ferrimonas balearica (strain DSM 9799 / CCM 4581 / KCTC 23876 / PAT) TaxID=550540 RepID=E1SWP0_FERBD|nr:oligopeptide ABC transporter permease OppB [Ferrimonas balearica]MBY6018002.1 oligopeptide ABC transporter permease OppB [Halomonas denitrificans]ADN77502.1 binding-protein-dependent transport systems inner membrane component [Ferrimonas balearica DSM 9799]MBW3139498.1 oligopeptide ABC transporter permease OppB [Ferrimonas balearica]MBW3164534.1 oligopeptide ABC transporter permease OppB [Ferrimonas balearica]MBY5980606.1 oligopeptide ABC transporter permease OppB [Ferrimonas balearica]
MFQFTVRRLAMAIPTLFILVTLSFFMMQSAPGSPFTGDFNLPPEVLANIEAKYHLDKPMWQQYLYYLGDLMKGDLGPSFKYRDYSVNELVAQSFPVSIKLGVVAFVFTVIFGVALGTVAALKQNTWVDYTVMSLAMVGVVLPSFVLAPVLVMIFAVGLNWLPAGGWNDGHWTNLVLPVSAMAILYMASIARIMRGSMIEVLHSPFIRTCHAKGLPMRYIIFKHALKPAMLPVVSYLGPAFVGIITGSVVIETVFGIPGIGQYFVNGALNRDYSLVLGLTILVGSLTILFTAIVDILYGLIDPRIRVEG